MHKNYSSPFFRSTNRQRTIESAKAFAQGAFPGYEVNILPPLENDPVIRFYWLCEKYKNYVLKNSETFKEKEKLEKSKLVQDMILRINAKLGFEANQSNQNIQTNETINQLNFSDLILFYKICRYEQQAKYYSDPSITSIWVRTIYKKSFLFPSVTSAC